MEKEFSIDIEHRVVTCSMYVLKENKTFTESAFCSLDDKFDIEKGKQIAELRTELSILKYRKEQCQKFIPGLLDAIKAITKDYKYFVKTLLKTNKAIHKKHKLLKSLINA